MFLLDALDVIRDFLDRGGSVLWLILFVLVVLWTLIIERFMYYKGQFPQERQDAVDSWMNREDRGSWYAHRVRDQKISELAGQLTKNISMVKTLVALCPLMGLLGTVTGMIAVFDVMAETGTGNARMMASGISMATIPTMAGMVAALSGLYFGNLLESKAKKEKQKLTEALPLS